MRKDILKQQIKIVADAIIAVESKPKFPQGVTMLDPQKVLWAKTIVLPVLFQNPGGPTEEVHELTLGHFPQWNTGVFITHLTSPLVSGDEPERKEVYIMKEAIPELIASLQKYLANQNKQEPQ